MVCGHRASLRIRTIQTLVLDFAHGTREAFTAPVGENGQPESWCTFCANNCASSGKKFPIERESKPNLGSEPNLLLPQPGGRVETLIATMTTTVREHPNRSSTGHPPQKKRTINTIVTLYKKNNLENSSNDTCWPLVAESHRLGEEIERISQSRAWQPSFLVKKKNNGGKKLPKF